MDTLAKESIKCVGRGGGGVLVYYKLEMNPLTTQWEQPYNVINVLSPSIMYYVSVIDF